MARQPILITEVVDKIIEVLALDSELQGAPLMGNIAPDVETTDAYPVLVVTGVTGESTRTLNAQHVWRSCTIQVTARDKGGTDKSLLVLIMRRVYMVLESLRIQEDGMYIGPISEARERPRGPDNRDGTLYPQIVVEFEMAAYRLAA